MKGYYGMEPTFDSTRYLLSTSSAVYDGTANSCTFIKDATNNGTVYVVSGSSGALDYSQKAFLHNAMQYSDVSIGGSYILEIEANRLDLKWICADGVIRDRFTMMKNITTQTTINIKPGETATLKASYIGEYRWKDMQVTTRSVEVKPRTGQTIYTVTDPYHCLQNTFIVNVKK